MTIGTDAFTELLLLEAEQRGMPELPHVIVPHPLGGLKAPAVQAKVSDDVLDEVLAALTRHA